MAQTFTKKTAAIAVAAGLAFSGSAGAAFAPVAQATPVVQPEAPVSDSAQSDNTITIHKRVGADKHGTPAPNGGPSTDVAGSPLAGAEFKIEKINVDMRTDEGFAKAAELQSTTGGVDFDKLKAAGIDKSFQARTAKTDANGEIVFGNLPIGAYLVTETAAPNAGDKAYVPSAPFIVYAPIWDEKAKDWNHDIHAYPKNTELTVTKKVKDEGKNPIQEDNRTLTYTIDSPVPLLPPQRSLTELSVEDAYKAGDFVNGLNIAKVEIVNGDTVKQTLKEGQYTVSGPTALAKPIEKDGKVVADTTRTVTVTDAAVLKGLGAGDALRVTLTGEAEKVQQAGKGKGVEDGEISNYARTTGKTQVTGKPGFDDTTFDTPYTSVETYIAAVKVVKHKKGEENTLLNGAKFDVYSVAKGQSCSAQDRNIIKKDFEVNGTAVINALHVVDYVDGKAVGVPAEQIKFCLVETAAPEGYNVDNTPREITGVTRANASAPQTVDGLTYSAEVKVPNEPRKPLQLPQTGGMGVLALILGGLALIGGGAFAARRKTA